MAISGANPLAMRLVESILMRAFGHPPGVLGRLGGLIMSRTNQRMAQRAVGLLGVQPSDRVLAEAKRTGQQAIAPKPGQIVEIDGPPSLERWWPELPWETAQKSPIVSSQMSAGSSTKSAP